MTFVSSVAAQDGKREARRAAGVNRTVNAGFVHHQAGRLVRAEALYRKALARDSEHAEALHLLGVIAYQQGKIEAAIELIERALPELHDLPEAHLNLGNALREAGRRAEAVDRYRRAIALDPDYGMAYNNLGRLLNEQGLFEAGLESSRRAIELIPDFLGANLNYVTALTGLGRFPEAETALRRSLDLAPDRAEIHRELGEILRALGRLDEAAASYRRALALKPDYAQAHCNLGYVLKIEGKLSEAIACFERGVAAEPDDAGALSQWFREKQNICDWSGYWENEAKVRNALASQHPTLRAPFALLALSSTPEEQLACARRLTAKLLVPDTTALPPPRPRTGDRIRLGYLSADFRPHPVAHLIARMIERHDRRRVEVAGYSWGPDDGSATRVRLAGAFDRFVDISDMSYRQAATLIHGDGVNILIDLMGYTGSCRPAILACRPAPIQVNYLGYPGTMGADFIDYLIVDRFVVPPDQQTFFSEQLVYLPDCYLCNDDRREIAERTPSRGECGLPDRGFVFCCFNASWKLTPLFFDIWMRLLHAVPESVLLLNETNPLRKANLRREAAARGIASERLVFAPRLPSHAEHLARYRLADLFLDTLPYNAHTTASDALWAGLPMLTCVGNTFVGRVAGSLLQAVGLDELVTTSLEEYEALALQLALDAGLLAQLRTRLAQNRLTYPLFDTDRFARNIEAAYTRMWEVWGAGRPPAPFSVPPSADALAAKPRRQVM